MDDYELYETVRRVGERRAEAEVERMVRAARVRPARSSAAWDGRRAVPRFTVDRFLMRLAAAA